MGGAIKRSPCHRCRITAAFSVRGLGERSPRDAFGRVQPLAGVGLPGEMSVGTHLAEFSLWPESGFQERRVWGCGLPRLELGVSGGLGGIKPSSIRSY